MLPSNLIVFTGLDGTLLDPASHSWAPAEEALHELGRRNIPLIFCSGKTRAEVEVLQRQMDNGHPFITENGGGIFIPDGYFPKKSPGATKLRHYYCLVLGRPYGEITEAFDALLEETGVSAEGFHQMSARDLASNTGLSLQDAALAAQREFDLPFFFAGAGESDQARFIAAAQEKKLSVSRSGRFWHLFSGSDPGRAVRKLTALYREAFPHRRMRTVALGDSANDLPMLKATDRAILLPQRRDQFDEQVLHKLPKVHRASAPGPAGWNQAILELLA